MTFDSDINFRILRLGITHTQLCFVLVTSFFTICKVGQNMAYTATKNLVHCFLCPRLHLYSQQYVPSLSPKYCKFQLAFSKIHCTLERCLSGELKSGVNFSRKNYLARYEQIMLDLDEIVRGSNQSRAEKFKTVRHRLYDLR